jgi:formate-dependent nitrite reductase membrane component NrfD
MSSTFFTASPHWRWLIVAYFFFGGLAGGSYFIATMLDLFGKDRRLVRLGHLVAFPLVCLCGLLLTVDLGRPLRFWHMLVQSETLRPMLKTYSPMSLGSWALMGFGACAFVSFVAVLAERGWFAWPALRRLGTLSPLGRLVTVLGALLGLYVAGYTGVLLAVTNRPIWADTTLLGVTFLMSAASTSAALLILLGARGGVTGESMRALERFDRAVLVLEVVTIVALIASLGRVATVWLNGWGVLLAAMILGGIALPLVIQARASTRGSLGPVLVLVGGLTLRAVIIFSSDQLR